jgi:hypothetical protein
LENRLFQVLLNISEGEVHAMLELISKLMSGTLEEKDVDLSPLKVVLADTRIPSVCSPRYRGARSSLPWFFRRRAPSDPHI